MARFRALKPLQASSLGLVRPGQEFEWPADKSIIGWHVEPLDDEARRMVAERAKLAGDKGAEEDKPLPTQPFPKSVMRASAGMTAPGIVGGTLNAVVNEPAPDLDAPNMSASPAPRRRAKAS